MLLFVFSEVQATVVEALRATTTLEWLAVLTGFVCVWLAARESLLNFPIAIFSLTICINPYCSFLEISLITC